MAADENACDAGDFESCDNLGLAYIGIKLEECDLDKNYEKAFALFKKACGLRLERRLQGGGSDRKSGKTLK